MISIATSIRIRSALWRQNADREAIIDHAMNSLFKWNNLINIMGEYLQKQSRRGRPQPEETQKKIQAVLSAARLEFSENGYQATTMDTIAAKAGVSKRSLYFWYTNKADLLRSCISNSFEQLQIPTPNADKNLYDDLSELALAILHSLSTDSAFALGALLGREGWQAPEISQAGDHAVETLVNPVARLLRLHRLPEDVSKRFATFFLAMLLTGTQRRLMYGLRPLNDREIKIEVRDCVTLFVHGLDGVNKLADVTMAE